MISREFDHIFGIWFHTISYKNILEYIPKYLCDLLNKSRHLNLSSTNALISAMLRLMSMCTSIKTLFLHDLKVRTCYRFLAKNVPTILRQQSPLLACRAKINLYHTKVSCFTQEIMEDKTLETQTYAIEIKP